MRTIGTHVVNGIFVMETNGRRQTFSFFGWRAKPLSDDTSYSHQTFIYYSYLNAHTENNMSKETLFLKNVSVVKLESTLSWYTIYQLETWLTWFVLWLNFTELYWMLPHFPVSNKFIHGKWLNQWLHNRPNSWNESVI